MPSKHRLGSRRGARALRKLHGRISFTAIRPRSCPSDDDRYLDVVGMELRHLVKCPGVCGATARIAVHLYLVPLEVHYRYRAGTWTWAYRRKV